MKIKYCLFIVFRSFITYQIYCVNIFLAFPKKIVVRTKKLGLIISVIADKVAKTYLQCWTNSLPKAYLQILFLICLQGMCDNSSSANEASMTCDNMTVHLENDEKYLRNTEVKFLLMLFYTCKKSLLAQTFWKILQRFRISCKLPSWLRKRNQWRKLN